MIHVRIISRCVLVLQLNVCLGFVTMSEVTVVPAMEKAQMCFDRSHNLLANGNAGFRVFKPISSSSVDGLITHCCRSHSEASAGCVVLTFLVPI